MLKVPLLGLLLRMIPEGILMIYISHLMSGTLIDLKKMLLSGVILGSSTYFIRLLPINFGIHIILILMIYMLLVHSINGIEAIKSIKLGFGNIALIGGVDYLWVMVYLNILGIPRSEIIANSITSVLLGVPSLVSLFILAVLTRNFMNMRPQRSVKNVFNLK